MTCGDPGMKTRARSCSNPTPQYNGANCNGDITEEANCPALIQCPINGVWSEWAQWSACSVTCGDTGKIDRSRACDSPGPLYNGLPCNKESYQENSCPDSNPCPGTNS